MNYKLYKNRYNGFVVALVGKEFYAIGRSCYTICSYTFYNVNPAYLNTTIFDLSRKQRGVLFQLLDDTKGVEHAV